MVNWEFPVLPAPLLRLEFKVEGAVRSARAMVCGLGYYELYLNGQKVGDHVLDPVVTQYDRRVRYVTHSVEDCLQPGVNAVGVMLGNGWYNCSTPDVWHFDKASWRDYPKLLLQIEIVFKDGRKVTIGSGPQWKVADSPLRFDSLRNGETYDARLEREGWNSPGYDDSDWSPVAVVPGPGGLLEEQLAPPCKVMGTLVPRTVHEVKPGVALFDFGRNIAGWVRLRVKGAAGTEVCLRYGERLGSDGTIDQKHIGAYIKGGDCQTDRYILKGGGEEQWESRFTYHGFQYVQVEGLPGTPSLDHLQGRVVHTAFEQIGSFACSNEDLNRLQECTMESYRGNFVGIPTEIQKTGIVAMECLRERLDGGHKCERGHSNAGKRALSGGHVGRRRRIWLWTALGVRRWRGGSGRAWADLAEGWRKRGIVQASGHNAGRI